MLYIISFQSISCSEASPTSSRPHKGPPEGSSARAEVAGLPIGHPLNLPPDFPHVLSSVLWPVIPSIFHPVSLTLLSSVLWPVPQNNSQAGPRGGLRHGHPTHRYLSAISACRTIQQSLSNSPLNGPRPVLATATLPTDTSVPSPRAEQSNNLSQTGL